MTNRKHKMAQSLESLFPRFGRAGNTTGNTSEWDADNFDVDMLTEYLLDDKTSGNGMTFDFNIEHANQGSFVSPENSEDGNMPLIGETRGVTITKRYTVQPILPQPQNSKPSPVVATPFPSLPITVPPGGSSGEGSTPKRRRMGPGVATAPMVAMATGGAPLITAPQLVAAAAQLQQSRGRKKSQAQIDRRRERNRVLAKRTRLRKKFFFESLQKEVMDLQRENLRLKEVVKRNMKPEDSERILCSCDAIEKMPESILEACGEGVDDMDPKDFNLVNSIQKSQHAFIITDPSLHDNPIVFASDDFVTLTGYDREQVLGRNCRFLQGSETSKEKVEHIRKQLAAGEDASVTLVNYKSDGSPFWNKLFVAALRDAQNNIVNFIGVTVEVASPEPGDLEHEKALPTTRPDDAAVNESQGNK